MVAINNISEASRIVIKVGSSLVTSKDGNINEGFLDIIASDLLELRNKNKEIIIVSSGAVSLGNIINKNKNSLSLSESQAASSIGQIKLINGWKNSLEKRDLKITVRFLSNEIRSDALEISIHERKCQSNGTDCSVNKIISEIEPEISLAILKRAAILEKKQFSKNVKTYRSKKRTTLEKKK